MIVGNPSKLAIESSITVAFESSSSFLALGYFILHIGDRRFGVQEAEATMLGCSVDRVERIISNRGNHDGGILTTADASEIADGYLNAFCGEEVQASYCGIPGASFCRLFEENTCNVVWAPDGDAAFDDGSNVLLFDSRDQVRLIAFQSDENCRHIPFTLRDLRIASDEFYTVLRQWFDAFHTEWASTPKSSTEGYYTEIQATD